MKLKLQLTTVAAVLACACAGVSMAQTTTPGTGGAGGTMTPSSPSTPPTHPTERTTPSNRMPSEQGQGATTTAPSPSGDAKSGSQAEAMQACKNMSGEKERKECMDKAKAMKPSGDVAPAGGGMPTRTEQAPSTGGTKPNPSGTSSGTGSPQK